VKTMLRIAILIILATAVDVAWAGEPVCRFTNSDRAFCQYTGKVSRAYVNDGGMILLYFDTALDPAFLSEVGFASTTSTAAAAFFRNSDNADFANALYSSMLTAQARDTTVTVQMYTVRGGYLVIDRIWVR
jgi:hypothetical protein